jgi:hypothetical protein
MLVQASFSAGGIGAHRFARVWTPLQRQYLWSYVWSAVAISRSGSYELLVIVDQTTRRMALDADIVPSHQRRAATRFPSRRRPSAVRPSASPGSGASGTVPRSTRCCGSGCIRIRPSVTWRGHRSGAPCRARGGPGPGDLGRDCSGSEPGDTGHRLSITAPPGLGLGNAGELILSIRSHTICP